MKNTFKIKGLDCANCATQLENAIQKIEGIKNTSISFMTERLVFECNEEKNEKIINQVKKVIKREEPYVKIEKI